MVLGTGPGLAMGTFIGVKENMLPNVDLTSKLIEMGTMAMQNQFL